GTLIDISDLGELKALFIMNGWTFKTAVSMMIFTLFHWPCATTLMTVKKETGNIGYTALSAVLPTFFGMLFCIIFNLIMN
ncbi:MAG: ferrous iron transporter B, partial [Clostridia bacterium]|nr:ferrous iron transporter B [Clostridia bacterium]